MFQQNLTAPDTGAASAVTQGVIDKSGAMREMSKAQQYTDMTNFALTAMDAGFKIDEHIQTKRMGEEMVEFKDQFAQEGLDAFSEEDMQYIQKFAGDLTAIQADQLREPIYKALIDKRFREASSKRPWLEDSLRSVAQKSTGQNFGDAVTRLSMEARALREKEMQVAEESRVEGIDSFFKSMEGVFTKSYVEVAKLGMDLSGSPQEVAAAFLEPQHRQIQFQNAAQLKALQDQVAIVQANTTLSDTQREQNIRSITRQMFNSGALNMNHVTETTILNMAQGLSEKGQTALSSVVSGSNIFSVIPEMPKEDLQKISMQLRSELNGQRAELMRAFGDNPLPQSVRDAIAQGEEYIQLIDRFVKDDPLALSQMKVEVRMQELEADRDYHDMMQHIKNTDPSTYNLVTLGMKTGSSDVWSIALQEKIVKHAQEFNKRVDEGDGTEAGALAALTARLHRFADSASLEDRELVNRYKDIASKTFEGFSAPTNFRYSDVVDLSETFSGMSEREAMAFLSAADPASLETSSINIRRSFESRLSQLKQRTESNEGMSFVTLGNGAVVLRHNNINETRDHTRIRQELNLMRTQILPMLIMMSGEDSTPDQILAEYLGLAN